MSIVDQLGLKNLKVFHALMKERNASRVADQVGLTQQAVSDQLRKMRIIFDDPLFVRKATGLIPTPAAERLFAKVDRLLLDLEDLIVEDTFDPATTSGTFSIAATDYAQIVVLPSVIEQVRQQAPNLRINIHDIDSQRVENMMQSGQINLLIAFPEFVPKSCAAHTLFTETYLCVASKDRRMPSKNLSASELAGYPQIAVSQSRPSYRESIDDWFDGHGLARNIVVTAPCFSLMPDYIQRTDAVAFLPSRSFDPNKLTIVNVEDGPKGFDVQAAWHARSEGDPLHNWILGIFRSQSKLLGVDGALSGYCYRF